MIVLLFFYQGKRRLKLNTSLLYRFTWNIVGVSLILDIVSLIGITYADSLPMILVDIICKAYLWSIVMEALGAMMYVCMCGCVQEQVNGEALDDWLGCGGCRMYRHNILPANPHI